MASELRGQWREEDIEVNCVVAAGVFADAVVRFADPRMAFLGDSAKHGLTTVMSVSR